MYLLIDLSGEREINLTLFDTKRTLFFCVAGPNRDTLSSIRFFLEQEACSIRRLGGVAVVVGSGGFTSTRIGTTLANVFVYTLHIPALAVSKTEAENLPFLCEKLRMLTPKYIYPAYAGEPNIGGVNQL